MDLYASLLAKQPGKAFESGPLFGAKTLRPAVSESKDMNVPLRHRQLPASFWQEPNTRSRYPFDYFSVPLTNMDPKLYFQTYKDMMQRLYGQVPGVGSRYPITEYLYYNYGSKYQAAVPPHLEQSWNTKLYQTDKKSHTIPPGYPLQSHPCPCSGYFCGATHTSNLDLSALGQYPSDGASLCPYPTWRPVPSKTTSSYPSRFHPFGDVQ